MTKPYDLIQVKQNLPETLQRIEDCKKIAASELWLYRCLVQQCIYETTHPNTDNGVWTTAEFMTETWNNYKRNIEEAQYLEKLVAQLKNSNVMGA